MRSETVMWKWKDWFKGEKAVSICSDYPIIKLIAGIFLVLLLSNIAYSFGENIGRFVYVLSH